MARKCASAAILETLRDPRVVTMPAAAQTLWIRIITAMQGSEISVLRFGSDIMNRTAIALFIQMAETEIETHLETLIARGLLDRDDDGAVRCPMLVQAVSRSEINRNNGKKGGRPRKDGQPPGQRTMLLPINGGAHVETEKTKPETETDASGSDNNNINKPINISDDEYHRLGGEVQRLVGCDPAKRWLDYGIVRQWLADGATPEMIAEVIAGIMERQKPTITSLKYFNLAIASAIAAKPKALPDWERKFNRAMAVWDGSGRIGPAPRAADYRDRAA